VPPLQIYPGRKDAYFEQFDFIFQVRKWVNDLEIVEMELRSELNALRALSS
jgi:hypothetical protein